MPATQQPLAMRTMDAMDLTELKNKINQLKTILNDVVAQIKTTLEVLHAPRTTETNTMDIDTENNMTTMKVHAPKSPTTHIDLIPIINKLKNDIAMITHKMRTMFQKYMPPQQNPLTTTSPIT